ncbi:TIM barrel protein [Candidatus Woesearchaeota archaeon]|nr:TIM barrel protein [Candidatus Woesearchaeota archaeon]
MNSHLGFSIGDIRSWENSANRQDLIKYFKNLPISAIELTFSNKNDLFSFKLNPKNKAWLKKLPYVSIHAPFNFMDDSSNKAELTRQLKQINFIYNQVNAKNVVFHPGQVPPKKLLKKYRFKASLENMSKSHGFSLRKLSEIMKKYPDLGFCLDVGHAYRYRPDYTKLILTKFKKRLSQIHLHGVRKGKDHFPLNQGSKKFMKSLEPILKVNVPIIIESDFNKKDINLLKSEILFIQNYFALP